MDVDLDQSQIEHDWTLYETLQAEIVERRVLMADLSRPATLDNNYCPCGLPAETELDYQKKIHHLCWRDAFALMSEINSKKATSKELFDRILDDCYLCKSKDHEIGNLTFMNNQLEVKLNTMIPKKKHWWNRR